jgi:hypothetical protein
MVAVAVAHQGCQDSYPSGLTPADGENGQSQKKGGTATGDPEEAGQPS